MRDQQDQQQGQLDEERQQDGRQQSDERTPLLQNGHVDAGEGGDSREVIKFSDEDPDNPRQWPRRRKMINITIIAMMSSRFRPCSFPFISRSQS